MTTCLKPQSKNQYEILLMAKNLWRQGFAICPEKCDLDNEEACSCSFNYAAQPEGLSSYEILSNVTGELVFAHHAYCVEPIFFILSCRGGFGVCVPGMMQWVERLSDVVALDEADGVYHVAGLDPDAETAAWDELLHHTLVHLGSVGEMFTSASPYDPTFWLVHGAADRLLQYRRLVAAEAVAPPDASAPSAASDASAAEAATPSTATGLPFDERWGYEHSLTPSDTQLVCDWAQVDSGAALLPSCKRGVCPGHNEHDVLPFGGFVDDRPATAPYTNAELYAFLSPLNADLPYTYDSFAWPHCDEELYKFGARPDGTFPTSFALPDRPLPVAGSK